MMRKLQSFLVVAFVAAGAFSGIAAPPVFQVNGVNYQVRENASEVVVALPDGGSQENYQYPLDEGGTLVIPSTVEYESETYTVTGVAKDAIVGQEAMTRLVLPPTMVDVMDGVHDCPALVYLDLGGASEVSTPAPPGFRLWRNFGLVAFRRWLSRRVVSVKCRG